MLTNKRPSNKLDMKVEGTRDQHKLNDKETPDPLEGQYISIGPNSTRSTSNSYQFVVNDVPLHDRRFSSNSICTSKYTWFNFLPKNLFIQFTKLANVYFLVIMVLQIIKPVSISNGKPAIVFPLALVVIMSGIKDIIEDSRRHIQDRLENNRKCLVVNPKTKKLEQTFWRNLKVGQVIKIHSDELFPCDILLLNSSDKGGLCYVETKNLDGETNLKHKKSHKEISQLCQNDADVINFKGSVNCEFPNDRIYSFDGVYSFDETNTEKQCAVGPDNFLLRGSSLKNCDYIYGLTVFAGHDTKIMKNQSKQRYKVSKLEGQLNVQVILIFIFQISIGVFGSIYGTLWERANTDATDMYLDLTSDQISLWKNQLSNAMQRFGTWMLMFSNMVPISMLVTLETVKMTQGIFMSWDVEIYDMDQDLSTKVQASNLNEELGQVNYLFSDKTGTLTSNVMDFKKFSVGSFSYGLGSTSYKSEMLLKNPNLIEDNITNVNFDDPLFYDHFEDPQSINYENIMQVLKFLAICHTIVMDNRLAKPQYNSSSPDELALVNGAKFFGIKFISRDDDNNIKLELQNGMIEIYKLLNVLEFNSDRKRMSVIVRDPNGKIKLMCKGADEVIKERLNPSTRNQNLFEQTEEFIKGYADEGLRTLLLAEKEFTIDEYEQWNKQYIEAGLSLVDRDDKISFVSGQIELDMDLIGSTAIEDKLQSNVGETITAIKQAGIKLWVLTGDKIETAVNIAYSCQLLTNSMLQHTINAKSYDEILIQLAEVQKLFDLSQNKLLDHAIILSGESLTVIQDDRIIMEKLIEIAEQADVVLACRISPKQKADLVTEVKNMFPEKITLAIGDGANDVNMINAAHVGVGINGREGQQAARTADFSIGQFQFLRQLMFVHGREAYRRNSYLIIYMFYKNVILLMPQFWFGFKNVFSGQTLYEPWIYQMYNIIFTALPIVWYAIFDSEHPRKTLWENPHYYQIGIKNECFNKQKFWATIFYGSVQAAFLLFFVTQSLESKSINDNGNPSSFWVTGMILYSIVVIIVNLEIVQVTNHHTIYSVMLQAFSISSFFLVYFIENSFSIIPQLYYTFAYLWTTPQYFFLTLFVVFWVQLSFKALDWWIKFKERQDLKFKLQHSPVAPVKEIISPKKLSMMLQGSHHGFAFSQEQGQAPQIFDNLKVQGKRRASKFRRFSKTPLQIPQLIQINSESYHQSEQDNLEQNSLDNSNVEQQPQTHFHLSMDDGVGLSYQDYLEMQRTNQIQIKTKKATPSPHRQSNQNVNSNSKLPSSNDSSSVESPLSAKSGNFE